MSPEMWLLRHIVLTAIVLGILGGGVIATVILTW